MEFINIDFDKEKDIKTIINDMNKNTNIAKKMLEEVDKNNKENNNILNKNIKNKEIEQAEIIQEEVNEKTNDEDFENEIDYYYKQIFYLKPSEDLKEKMIDILPSPKKNNYNKIISRIKLEIMKNIKEIKETIIHLIDITEKQDLEEFRNEILFEKKKIEIIDERTIELEENAEIKEEIIENNLIFIPTANGNIRVLEELEKIDQEYFDGFKQLFNSIKDGTLKKVKNFSNNKKMNISEVRGDKVRVIFDRIGKNDYAVITAFIKKCNKDSGYYNLLEVRIKNYENLKEEIIENLKNDEFREKNIQYDQELYNILDNVNVDIEQKQKRREK